jgi:putative transposase
LCPLREVKELGSGVALIVTEGISTGEIESALAVRIGPEAKGLSITTIAKLKREWAEDYVTWRSPDWIRIAGFTPGLLASTVA